MANKQEIKDKIQTIAKRVYLAKTKQSGTLGVSAGDVDFDKERFPVLAKFSTLKHVIINLLTDQYEDFISDIYWVAPRPTTFKIILANNQIFYLIYTERSWIAKVEGKKYYLLNINEEMRAAESISRLLSYGGGKDSDTEEANTPIEDDVMSDKSTPNLPPVEETPPTEDVPEELPN